MLGGPHGHSSWAQKILPPPGLDPWTIQPVASHYTDYTIPAQREYPHINFFLYWQKASYIVIFSCRTVRNLPPPTLWIYFTSWSHPPRFVFFSLHSLTSLLVMSLTEENAVDMLSMVDGLLVTNKWLTVGCPQCKPLPRSTATQQSITVVRIHQQRMASVLCFHIPVSSWKMICSWWVWGTKQKGWGTVNLRCLLQLLQNLHKHVYFPLLALHHASTTTLQ